jgi:hypothetical protein
MTFGRIGCKAALNLKRLTLYSSRHLWYREWSANNRRIKSNDNKQSGEDEIAGMGT